MSISIIFPTRKRPQNLYRFAQSLADTCGTMPEVIVYIDADDQESFRTSNAIGFKCVQGPRQKLSACYNAAAALATSSLLMYAGDDIVFRTKNWDIMVQQEFDKRQMIVVHGDDMSHGGKLHATHGILHKKWIETVGYFAPPHFGPWFDRWITAIANDLNARVYVPFVNEHLHYTNAKADYDPTYSEARHGQEQDSLIYDSLTPQRLADTAKLRAYMENCA